MTKTYKWHTNENGELVAPANSTLEEIWQYKEEQMIEQCGLGDMTEEDWLRGYIKWKEKNFEEWPETDPYGRQCAAVYLHKLRVRLQVISHQQVSEDENKG